MRKLSNDQARRIALAAQGFADVRPAGRIDRRHFRKVINQIGLLQLDSVNVLERSHYLPMWSRLGNYSRSALDEFTARSGEMFEYWGHEASLLPVASHRLFRWRMEEMEPWRRVRGIIGGNPGYVESVRAEIAAHGPLTVSDLADPGDRTGPWWGHGKGKTALDWLFAKGQITAYRNGNFGRLYDLPERVIPRKHLEASAPSKREAFRELLLLAARHHGLGTATDLADYYRLHRPTARTVLAEMAAAGDVEPVEVVGWKHPAFMYPGAKLPRKITGAALLSPFDPVVWERDRTQRLFGFHYRIEIYVPKPKRVYGYYVLPFLVDGELVGRVDLKSDRRNGALLVQGSYVEPDRDVVAVASRLAEELEEMSRWLGLAKIQPAPRGNLAAALRKLV
jgi:uncharacterized protein YcaQ